MAHQNLELRIRRGEDHVVNLEVHFEDVVGERREEFRIEEEEVKVAPPIYGLDPDDLESRDKLLKRFADYTRGEDDGALVRAICFEPDRPKLLKLLNGETTINLNEDG